MCTLAKQANAFQESETLRLLRAKKTDLVLEKAVYEQEADLLNDYGRTLSGEHVSIDQMSQFLKSFRERRLSVLAAVRGFDESIHKVEKAINEETGKESKGKSNGQVTVILHVEDDSTVTLRLTYSTSTRPYGFFNDIYIADTWSPSSSSPSCFKCTMGSRIRSTRIDYRNQLCHPPLSSPCHSNYRRRLERHRAHTEHLYRSK